MYRAYTLMDSSDGSRTKIHDLPSPSSSQSSDPLRPTHYRDRKPEPITVIEGWGLGFCLGNAIKYIARAPYKGTELQDLRKALWYLERYITVRESEERDTEPPTPAAQE